ncbi:MAG TPA: succinylglutamate desuccinylase/aspartoacylase family protein [Chloroflexota bacterium]|nr:succinylglutamate desuccinylase/aspartoacylase family protein [Chloroflexota bacterium]
MAGESRDVTAGGARIAPGERANLRLSLGTRPDGSPLGIPLMVVNGARPGPRLGITTGIHGDEFEGAEGLRRFLSRVDPAELRGRIIATPQANPPAFERFARTGDVDQLDLNRSFPGNPEGFLTHRIADLLVTEIVDKVDYLIDLHGGGMAYDLLPYVGFNSAPGEVGEASLALARAFGIEHLYASTPFPNVMRLEAAKRGIPAILVEAGGNGRLDGTAVAAVDSGLWNVAEHLDMVDAMPRVRRQRFCVVKAPPDGEFAHAPTGGFLLSSVFAGQHVNRGQLLGTLVDVFGAELARIESAIDGIVVEYRTVPVTRTGDWSFAVLEIVTEVGQDTRLADIAGKLE